MVSRKALAANSDCMMGGFEANDEGCVVAGTSEGPSETEVLVKGLPPAHDAQDALYRLVGFLEAICQQLCATYFILFCFVTFWAMSSLGCAYVGPLTRKSKACFRLCWAYVASLCWADVGSICSIYSYLEAKFGNLLQPILRISKDD